MFKVTDTHQVFLYPGITDFRLGIYGLRKLIGNDARPGSIYIFANKTLSSIKVIEIETNAVWLYQKKLHRGKFSYPRSGNVFSLSKAFRSLTRLRPMGKKSNENSTRMRCQINHKKTFTLQCKVSYN